MGCLNMKSRWITAVMMQLCLAGIVSVGCAAQVDHAAVEDPIADDALATVAQAQVHQSFNPVGTSWSVCVMENNGTMHEFHPVPWTFNSANSFYAGTLWTGNYSQIPGSDNGFTCNIVSDTFEVYFVTPDRFIATKNGQLYRFGKKL